MMMQNMYPNLTADSSIKNVFSSPQSDKMTADAKLTKEVDGLFVQLLQLVVTFVVKIVLNQLLENSKLLDTRLAEEDFPISSSPSPPEAGKHHSQNKEEVLLLDIPFMLSSFLLSQVTHIIIITMVTLCSGPGLLSCVSASEHCDSYHLATGRSSCSFCVTHGLDTTVYMVNQHKQP